jgi:hypothetical protein
MAKTYRPENLSTSEKDAVRFLIGDTTTGSMVLDDDEILYLLSVEANVWMAAASAADAVVGVINGGSTTGAVVRKRVGQTDISYANGKTAAEYADLAARLRKRSGHQLPFAGGISASDKLTRSLDSDLPQGRLRSNQFDMFGPGRGSDLLDQ